MRYSNSKALLVLIVVLVLALNNSAQTARFSDETDIETEVERLLQKRDVGDLANELARKKSQTTFEMLIKLSVFARAGHRQRVHETLTEIGKTFSGSPNKTQVFQVVKKAVSRDDLTAQKIFYERFAVDGDDRADEFINLWRQQNAAARAIETWLMARSENSETWWNELLRLKQSLGTANEFSEELAQNIRRDPSDFRSVQKYLQAALFPAYSSDGSNENNQPDVSWLAEIVETDTAYQAYELGTYLKEIHPLVAVELFEKSLALPFTEKDSKIFGERAFPAASIPLVVKNPEKQLRFWTKTALAETLQKNNQPQFAQPIVEELTKIDTSDIQTVNVFALAGAVQLSSGRRVIEAKILQDEAANENSPDYWLDRAKYYSGRKEKEQVWQTYVKALEKFEYKPNDLKISHSRLRILSELRWFGTNYKESEVEEILRGEFNTAIAANDSDYIFSMAQNLSSSHENLLNEFFVNRELLPQILSVRNGWAYDEQHLIRDVMESEEWDASKRELVWDKLTVSARKDLKNRAFQLLEEMPYTNRNAIPLLQECLRIAPKEYNGDGDFARDDIERKLFDARLEIGDWRKAEKMFVSGFRHWGNELGKVAVAAAKSGDIADAIRVWKIYANFDRRNLGSELSQLAETDAKPLLRKFYQQMKKNDLLTDAPDKALLALKSE